MQNVHLNTTAMATALAAADGIVKAAAEIAQHSATLAKVFAEALAHPSSQAPTVTPIAKTKPTLDQCREAQNKIGVNLSPRGVEIIYRLFDHDSSVRAASISMGISHRAAKWRKNAWLKAGGKARPTVILDID
ncbi:hypothetical protein [Sphingosinicella sp. YJ22]|uniref:hypothetical protein n=1 Tax=Sphingosinicella sp. YJ22 TaxID=1104780 RepID=UPI0014085990|nr:hypothetical protein [Sphingosinicella sp. YJ22]